VPRRHGHPMSASRRSRRVASRSETASGSR
jgi:hypothetical protein